MSEEKKKGFWSWLGFGKKKEGIQEEPIVSEENTELTESNNTESAFEELKKVETSKEPEVTSDSFEQEVEHLATEQTEEIIEEAEPVEQVEIIESAVSKSVILEDVAPSVIETVVETEQVEEIVEETVAEITEEIEEPQLESAIDVPVETKEKPSEGGFFSRLLKGLLKTKENIGAGFRSFFLGKKIDDELFEELEEQMIIADIGVPTTTKIIKNLEAHASRSQLKDAELLYQQLKVEMSDILKPVAQPLVIDNSKKPYVILMVGVNGVGKTTTIGKLARQFQQQGKSVMLAAGDTFRAAAVEQLQVWGERNHIPVVAQSTGSDSASVIFDAMQSAAAKNIDILIADTAGRLQNKNNLMDELKKIVRVMKKYDETAPHEIMLTLDAGTGQNAISQAKLFNEAVGLTGLTITKLDGTAKGGVIFAIADQFNLPIRYIGVGEKIEDLRPFVADDFIEALFAHEE